MTARNQHNTTDRPKPQIGKDEMNLCEFPIAKLGRRDTRDVIEFVGEIVKDGRTITQEWIVSGTARVGLPTEFAERVLVALISMAAGQGFAQKTTFTVYGVLKLMGLEISGFHYQEVAQAIKRLHGVTITCQNSWWDNEKKKHCTISEGFHLIDRYWLKRMADETGETGGGWVLWNDWLWESFQAGYVKNLDTTFYYGLDNTLARRLYRFLDKRMHYQDTYQIDLFALAARLGMAEYRYPSKVKEKLRPAFEELIARGYLRMAEVVKSRNFTRVQFVRTTRRQAQQASLWEDNPEITAEAIIEGPIDAKDLLNEINPTESDQSSLATLYIDYGTNDTLRRVWGDILSECAGAMPSGSYRMIADSALLEIATERAVIAINAKNRDWVERQMKRKFLNRLNQHLDTKLRDVRFIDVKPVTVA